VLELRGIEKRFGATVALGGVDLAVGAGEVHALIGENGAGKSTMLNIVAGLLPPDDGEIRREGAVAYIHQELALCPHLSVAENILLGAEPSSRGWLRRAEMARRAAALLEEFGRSDIHPAARTGALSLADQQVVEICRALSSNARIILMDEPTSSLQRANVDRLFRLIRQLRDRGMAVVYVSHFLEEVREIADRYTVLRDGKNVATGELRSVTDDQLIAMMVGRPSPAASRHPLPQAGEGSRREFSRPAERGEGGPKGRVRGDVALTFANIELHRGEILGIAGLIGSGRTELLRELFDQNPSAGYLSEDRKGEGLALQLSIADNITLSRFSTCARAGWIDLRRQAQQAEAAMQRVRVKASGPWMRVFKLSGGNQQKVMLGRLLHQDADILLLDEPARGVDIGSKSDIYREIEALAAAGKAIVIVSSYLPELFAVCDRIAVMMRGRLSPARPVSEWTPDSVMQVAIAGV
jgi:ribose transport system ATP-binding protein